MACLTNSFLQMWGLGYLIFLCTASRGLELE